MKMLRVSFLIAITAILFTAKVRAQAKTTGWVVGFNDSPGCTIAPGAYFSQAVCDTAQEDCNSVRNFFNSHSYANVVRTGPAYLDGNGNLVSGLSCSYFYFIPRLQGLLKLLPHGDPNIPKQNGGSPCTCDCSCQPSDDSPNNAPKDANVDRTGNSAVSEPVTVATGNMFYSHTDYATAGPNRLSFTRYFNSREDGSGPLGVGWHTNFDRFIWLYSASSVAVQRGNGQLLSFTLTGGNWVSDSDVDYTLVKSGATWTLTTPNDSVETYIAVANGYAANVQALLQSIRKRNGYTQSLHYDGNNYLTSVVDSYGRSLTLTYNTDYNLATVDTPDGTTLNYGYTAVNGIQNITSVTYPTSPATSLTYVYENATLFNTLTGVLDESGSLLYSWTYDADARALTSQIGNGPTANLTTIAYDDTSGTRTVTNALGVTDTYTFSSQQNMRKLIGINRAATATTAAASRVFTYDTNGYLASSTDWNGTLTNYVNSPQGFPTSITEAVGTPQARSTTITYTYSHPDIIMTMEKPGLSMTSFHDANGNPLAITWVDTTTTTVPYSTKGSGRTWLYTYDATGEVLSAADPRKNKTKFAYTSGALTRVTDALGHVTKFTVNGGGRPLTILDPNAVSTTITYDGRQRPLTSTVATAAGPLTTSWTYYNRGDVTTTLPDGSLLMRIVDSAHRQIAIADNYDNQLDWVLDANGDAVDRVIFDPSGAIKFQRPATYDGLGRMLKDTSTVTSASTVYTYDSNGNVLTVTDPLGHTTVRVFDPLNRLTQSTDVSGGVTSYTFDQRDLPLTVTDPNGNTTTYVYDGFGNLLQQTSPDTGVTVYHYDNKGNLTKKTDADAAVTKFTYDDLSRILTKTYPADSTLNVAFTYDQAGHGKGIGRLTSLTDAAGSLSRNYDERGNMLAERRVNGTNTLLTAYTYDAASRVSSIVYPSGAVSSFTRDSAGRVIRMPFAATGGDQANSLFTITHLPFGPVNYIKYNNGDLTSFAFDADYRQTKLEYDNYQNVPYLQWIYGYDNADNVSAITDGIKSANDQAFGYDPLNRLTSASSSGTYGTLSWKYDPNGNLLSRVSGSTTFAYGYKGGTNRLSTSTWPGFSETYTYTATGNVNRITANGSPAFIATYTQANRLNSVTGGPVAIKSMIYDAFGKRIAKADPGNPPILYSYDLEGNLIEENNSGVVTDYIYLDGVNVANWEPSQHHLYAMNADRLGTPLVSRDEYGVTNWAAFSQPYGFMTQTVASGAYSGPVTQNLRLPGQYYDPEYTLHHNGFRDYAEALGRYIEADPIGLVGGTNSYIYGSDNPQTYIDKNGLCPLGYNCASEHNAGYVYNVQYCLVGCVGYSINGAGYHYIDLGLGFGKWGGSLTYTNDMQNFCQGSTLQAGEYGGALGGNQDAGGFSASLPGGSVTFGIPAEDIASAAQQTVNAVQNAPSQIYNWFYDNPLARTMQTVAQALGR